MDYLDKVLVGAKASDFYCKMKFAEEQLLALKKIYETYFEPLMPKDYNGGAITLVWGKQAIKNSINMSGVHSNVRSICVNDAGYDPLWEEYFSDILPYMTCEGNIGLVPGNNQMNPHVDRAIRPTPIYFPIKGCSDQCLTDFYILEKLNQEDRQWRKVTEQPTFSVPVSSNAVLYNVREWHGIRNLSNQTRIAFGWDTKIHSFDEAKKIFAELGYIDDY